MCWSGLWGKMLGLSWCRTKRVFHARTEVGRGLGPLHVHMLALVLADGLQVILLQVQKQAAY